ncbi:leucine-rich repeat protein SHOC-2-like [Gigantopelta aegis]|uniref:leucine-rich repeat protein SHOC-2-like n=1 Tax=Gigantopelta aegis TaxID=1735272 RepID=UPI001B88BB60|nr:leucine-rich repeat protein SHOC-2-like [Gigantopelta aegis]
MIDIMSGKEVTKVVIKCNQAKEDGRLDLSDCQLTQIPDAIYILVRSTTIEVCNLSRNLLRQIPPKVGTTFPNITVLHLSGNRLSTLPNELAQMTGLCSLDIASNNFRSLPTVTFSFTSLKHLNAENNNITDLDVERLKSLTCLEEVNFENNPLTSSVYNELLNIKLFIALVTPQDQDLDSVD